MDSTVHSNAPERKSPETSEDNCYGSLHIIICYTDDHNPQLTYKFLMDHIVSEIPHKWYEFGSALAITPPQMEEIKENHSVMEIMHLRMLSKYGRQNILVHSPGRHS